MTKKARISVLVFCLILGIAGGIGLILIEKHLSRIQVFALIAGIVALVSVIEIIAIVLEEKHEVSQSSRGSFEMVGRRGLVLKQCSPEGTVKIGSEIWTAVIANGTTLREGEEIIVTGRQGLKLLVEPVHREIN
jgi:membrane protein implicated in regulation of membrane protease activity